MYVNFTAIKMAIHNMDVSVCFTKIVTLCHMLSRAIMLQYIPEFHNYGNGVYFSVGMKIKMNTYAPRKMITKSQRPHLIDHFLSFKHKLIQKGLYTKYIILVQYISMHVNFQYVTE